MHQLCRYQWSANTLNLAIPGLTGSAGTTSQNLVINPTLANGTSVFADGQQVTLTVVVTDSRNPVLSNTGTVLVSCAAS